MRRIRRFELITNLRGGDGRAVGIGNAFAADDGDEAVSVVAALDIGENLVLSNFRSGMHKIWGASSGSCLPKRRRRAPACFSSDALEDDELIDFFISRRGRRPA